MPTPQFTLDSPQNPRVKGWLRAIKKRELVLIEGYHPIEAALNAGVALSAIISSETTLPFNGNAEQVIASPRVLSALSETSSPPPCLALAPRDPFTQQLNDINGFVAQLPVQPRLLVLLNLQDPGNVGTLLRSARAFGCHGVLLGQPMVDVYSPKVIRSTAGWHFGLPMLAVSDWSAVVAKLPALHWLLTVGQTDEITPTPYTEISFAQQATAIVLGNEGQGLLGNQSTLPQLQHALENASNHTTQWVTIPTAVESLNVAVSGSILLAHQQTCSQALLEKSP